MYTTVHVPLLLGADTRDKVWVLRARQRQAYNLGVELGLGSDRVPSAWSGDKTLTEQRRSGDMPTHNQRLQRAGLRRGLAAVDQFRKKRFGLEQSVVYWTDKAANAAELPPFSPRHTATWEYRQRDCRHDAFSHRDIHTLGSYPFAELRRSAC